MVESCPVCDTLWRLYRQATDNLHELVGKHGDARDKGDPNTEEILSAEITIAESALHVVRRELRRHEAGRHNSRQDRDQQDQKGKQQPQSQKT